jgi:hypothetical protein
MRRVTANVRSWLAPIRRPAPAHAGDLFVMGSPFTQSRRERLRVNPLVAIAIAVASLFLCGRSQTGGFSFLCPQPQTVDTKTAVDISVRRLVLPRVARRIELKRRATASPLTLQQRVDDEIQGIRNQPLYQRISDTLVDHLRDRGYNVVTLLPTTDAAEPKLAIEPEQCLDKFMRWRRCSFPPVSGDVAAYLKTTEESFGKEIVERTAEQLSDVVVVPYPALIPAPRTIQSNGWRHPRVGRASKVMKRRAAVVLRAMMSIELGVPLNPAAANNSAFYQLDTVIVKRVKKKTSFALVLSRSDRQ